ncbi:PAS domain S-box protein [Halodesulfovibrio sp. MK-HDV]|jgi:PAS domain S-box-containing protein|uniref:PAS domain-containing sensor histidine kinase n=1 Tax=Halodesulfovibrio sp. MK-HDV TaxID=2599925 RepID=UPI001368E635|nr:PAS domain S-box protein [Halodesulfovibrio sp. MK-HDV]KAF1075321.1 Signal transduction histidine-protein kinase/phosphatase DegS [Halodesulfovibrio sp. MK-HDV]
MSGVSGKNGRIKSNADKQQSANDFEAFVAQYICDAEVPSCTDTVPSSQSVLPYELLLKVLDSGPMAIALFSETCCPMYWNDRFEQYFGSLEGANAKRLTQKKTSLWRCVGQNVFAVRERQQETNGECCKLSEHGTYVWFETRTQIVKADGAGTVYLYVATDITHQKTAQIGLKQTRDELEERVKERTTILAKVNNTLEEQVARSKRQQQALVESEERFRNIFLNKHGVRLLWDTATFEIEEANSGAAEFYGYEQGDMIGQPLQKITGMSTSAVHDRIDEVRRSGQVSFTALHRQANGEMKYVEVHFVGAKNRGRLLVYAFIIDISERIEAERKVHEHKNNLKALMNAMGDCALLVDPDGQVITMNHAAGQEFKCVGQSADGVNIFDILSERVADAWRGAFDAVLVMGMAEHIETDVSRCWNVSFFPVFTESLDISAVAIYAEDITFEKRTAEQMKLLSKRVLSAQEDERKRIGRELHDSTAQTISGIKYLLESEVARMERGAQIAPARLGKMIELLQGAIVELRHIIMALRPTILDDLGLISALRWLLNEASILHPSFSFSGTFDLSEQIFSELQKTVLFRVAQEALTNAAKHSRGNNISLHIKQEGNNCVLYVQDDGVGFAVDNCSRAGVGLGSMRERIELANGSLDILSLNGEGTLVRAAVPICAVDMSK